MERRVNDVGAIVTALVYGNRATKAEKQAIYSPLSRMQDALGDIHFDTQDNNAEISAKDKKAISIQIAKIDEYLPAFKAGVAALKDADGKKDAQSVVDTLDGLMNSIHAEMQ